MTAANDGASAERWRKYFPAPNVVPEATSSLEVLESASTEADNPADRIARAKEAMIRLIKDRFGGDGNLVAQIDKLVVTSEEAVAILAEPDRQPTEEQLASLEAIVAFDGTRPSFLLKNNEVDFASSFNTGNWQSDLAPHGARLAAVAACVGRVELNEEHIGTAFLVTPTLAITNRHVAQAIAKFENDKIRSAPGVTLNFGREQWNECASFDRRDVQGIVFAGKEPIVKPIAHDKLDLAVLRLSSSSLAGDLGLRHLTVGKISGDDFDFAKHVIAIGYPAKPDDFVPKDLKTEFAKVLERLLEGDGGAKRLAPGVPEGVASGAPAWTAMHDATTINGNSGSPLVVIKRGAQADPFAAAGLHYGGDWGGGRVNWAHLLALAGDATGYGTKQTFADFCRAEGIGER